MAPRLAMAHGALVVAARQPQNAWLIEDETCLKFTPHSGIELAYQLSRAAIGHPRAIQAARGGARYVRQQHDLAQTVRKLLESYSLPVDLTAGAPVEAGS